jgi:hypothetical protein
LREGVSNQDTANDCLRITPYYVLGALEDPMAEKRVECEHCGQAIYIRRCDCCGMIIKQSKVSNKEDHDFEVWAVAVNAKVDGGVGIYGDHNPTPEKFDACSVGCCTALINASGERFVGARAAHNGTGGCSSWRTHNDPTSPKDPIGARE